MSYSLLYAAAKEELPAAGVSGRLILAPGLLPYFQYIYIPHPLVACPPASVIRSARPLLHFALKAHVTGDSVPTISVLTSATSTHPTDKPGHTEPLMQWRFPTIARRCK